MPLAREDQSPGRSVIVVVLALLALDVSADGVRDELIGAAGLVRVDHRGALAVVAHAGHQVPERGAALRGELVSDMAQVVEVQAWRADRRDRARPGGCLRSASLRL